MNQITSIRNGAVVSNCNGKEENGVLMLPVSGVAQEGAQVFVNSVEARREGPLFHVTIPLREHKERIVMETRNEYGRFTQELSVLYDRNSFPRYNFFLDDNIFFLTEIARTRPKSLFDHFYTAFLKRMYETYDAKFTLNLFYRNDHSPFELKDFPDCYKKEFEENSHWLRLSWHAYSEFPDRPYQNCSLEKLSSDMELIRREIFRFAGERSYIDPVAIHWSIVRPEALPLLYKSGVRVLSGQFINPQTSLSENGPKQYLCDVGYFRNLPDCLYLGEKQLLHDFDSGITFLHSLLICNYYTPREIVSIMHNAMGNSSYNNLLSLETHEQYSFPSYFNYLPDHLERIETAIRTATEAGYKSVFFAEGFLGNPSC